MTEIQKKIYNSFFRGDSKKLYEYLKDKNPEIHFDYDEIEKEAHDKAFTVAKITKLDLIKDIQKSLSEAVKNGVGFEEWKKNIKPTLAKKGWLGDVEVTNPKTGEIKNIYVGNRRLKTIYSTNMQVARSKGRYESQIDSFGEYFVYIAVMDSLTRPAHAKHHMIILPKNHPFWDTHYPPNDYNCRCVVRVYTESELKKRGWTPSNKAPSNFAHKDWAYNPGKTNNMNDVWDDKIKRIEDKNLRNKGKDEKNKNGK